MVCGFLHHVVCVAPHVGLLLHSNHLASLRSLLNNLRFLTLLALLNFPPNRSTPDCNSSNKLSMVLSVPYFALSTLNLCRNKAYLLFI